MCGFCTGVCILEVSLLQVAGPKRCVYITGVFITGGWSKEVCVYYRCLYYRWLVQRDVCILQVSRRDNLDSCQDEARLMLYFDYKKIFDFIDRPNFFWQT